MAKGKFEDITGQRFGKLTVTSRIENRDNRPYFMCSCDCGKTKEVSAQNLKKGSVQSCGCFRRESKFKDLTGQIFGRFTVMKENGFLGEGKAKKTAFLCKCECGEEKTVRGADLVSGKILSCGCFRIETSIENLLNTDNRVRTPSESSAFAVYNKNYSDGNLNFKQFLDLANKNCYYCGVLPNNNYNAFKYLNKVSNFSIENGNFNYNGLDRIDSKLPHDFENLVAACGKCNTAKSNMNIDEFKEFISKSYNHIVLEINNIGDVEKYSNLEIDKSEYNRKYHPSISTARRVFSGNYNDGDLTFEYFIKITQNNCVYCDSGPKNISNSHKTRSDSSKYAIDNGDFYYNGLDRLNSSLPHNIDNCVPACRECNWAKGDSSVDEYKAWVIRTYNHMFK